MYQPHNNEWNAQRHATGTQPERGREAYPLTGEQRYTGNQGGPYRPPQKKQSVAGVLLAVAVVAGLAGAGTGYLAASSTVERATRQLTDQYQQVNSDVMQLSNAPVLLDENTSTLESVNEVAAAADGTITNVAEGAGPAVVEISIQAVTSQPFVGDMVTQGNGSGVIISQDGYIVTNNHVVEGAQSISVMTTDGKTYAAQLIGRDEQTDLAVVKIEATGLPVAEFGNSDSLRVGELAIAIGNPLGQLGGTVTSGIVSAAARDMNIGSEQMTLIQTSAAVNPGNSGGGLFNKQGQLIGVVNAKLAGSQIEGLAFAIPANTVREVVDEIIDNGYVTGRPQLGIEVVDIQSTEQMLAYRLGIPGVYVARDYSTLGLAAADRLLSVDGNEVGSLNRLKEVLEGYAVGDTVQVVLDREGQSVEAALTLTEQGVADEVQQSTNFETV